MPFLILELQNVPLQRVGRRQPPSVPPFGSVPLFRLPLDFTRHLALHLLSSMSLMAQPGTLRSVPLQQLPFLIMFLLRSSLTCIPWPCPALGCDLWSSCPSLALSMLGLCFQVFLAGPSVDVLDLSVPLDLDFVLPLLSLDFCWHMDFSVPSVFHPSVPPYPRTVLEAPLGYYSGDFCSLITLGRGMVSMDCSHCPSSSFSHLAMLCHWSRKLQMRGRVRIDALAFIWQQTEY